MKFASLLWLTVLSSRAVLSAPAGSEETKLLPAKDNGELIETDEHSKDSAELKVLAVEQNSKNEASGSDETKPSPSEAKLHEISTDEHKEDKNIMVVELPNQNIELKASTVEKDSKTQTQITKANVEVKSIDEKMSNAKANTVDDVKIKKYSTNSQSVEDNKVVKATVSTKQVSNKLNPLPKDSNQVEISVAKDNSKETDNKLESLPVSMTAIPEIATNLKLINDAKNDIEMSLRKIKESKKVKQPVSQEDDKTKTDSKVSTNSKFFKPIEIIKEFAIFTGTFINSLLQVPIVLLTKLKNIIAH